MRPAPGRSSVGRMDVSWPWREAVVDLLELAQLAQPDGLAAAVNQAVRPLGLDMTIYLVDLEQRALRPLPEPGNPLPPPLAIEATVAGRVFLVVRTAPAPGGGGEPERLWLPLVDGSERPGGGEGLSAGPGVGAGGVRAHGEPV